jgi:flagellar basal-body rod protein FlgC
MIKSLAMFFVILAAPMHSWASNDLAAANRIASSGMKLQSARLKVVAQNIANSNTTGRTPGSEPYRRKVTLVGLSVDPTLEAEISVIDAIGHDTSPFNMRYEPHHPAANSEGMVLYPNIQETLEMADAREAQRTYEANLASLEISKSNQQRLLEAMK